MLIRQSIEVSGEEYGSSPEVVKSIIFPMGDMLLCRVATCVGKGKYEIGVLSVTEIG